MEMPVRSSVVEIPGSGSVSLRVIIRLTDEVSTGRHDRSISIKNAYAGPKSERKLM
jgi:hypothetical protein